MMLSGLVVLAFFVYHIAHFTWRVTGPQPPARSPDGRLRRVHDAGAGLPAAADRRLLRLWRRCCSPRTSRTASTACSSTWACGAEVDAVAQERAARRRLRPVRGLRLHSLLRPAGIHQAMNLDAQDPRWAHRATSGAKHKLATCRWSTRPTSASSRSSWWAPAWPARRPRPRWPSWATRSRRSASRTRPRRAHSIAAQGGINAAKNYQNDGDSVLPAVLRHGQGRRLPRPRGQRLPPGRGQSANIIDQCVAQGVPFAREYGGTARQPLLRRRAGVAHLLRPRPDRPAAAARRLPGAGAADRPRAVRDAHPPRDARARSSSTATPAASSPATW